jgi:hypothetical protein
MILHWPCTSHRTQAPRQKPTLAQFGWRVLALRPFPRRSEVCAPVASDCQRHRGPQYDPCQNTRLLRRSLPFPYQRQRTLADTIARYRLRLPRAGPHCLRQASYVHFVCDLYRLGGLAARDRLARRVLTCNHTALTLYSATGSLNPFRLSNPRCSKVKPLPATNCRTTSDTNT